MQKTSLIFLAVYPAIATVMLKYNISALSTVSWVTVYFTCLALFFFLPMGGQVAISLAHEASRAEESVGQKGNSLKSVITIVVLILVWWACDYYIKCIHQPGDHPFITGVVVLIGVLVQWGLSQASTYE